MKKYYVSYVKNCYPALAQFSSKKKMEKWVENFQVFSDDDWIDFTFSTEDLEILDDSVDVRKMK